MYVNLPIDIHIHPSDRVVIHSLSSWPRINERVYRLF